MHRDWGCKLGELFSEDMKGSPCKDFKWGVPLSFCPPRRAMLFTVNYPHKTLQHLVKKSFPACDRSTEPFRATCQREKVVASRKVGGKAVAWGWQGEKKSQETCKQLTCSLGCATARCCHQDVLMRGDEAAHRLWCHNCTAGCSRHHCGPIGNLNTQLLQILLLWVLSLPLSIFRQPVIYPTPRCSDSRRGIATSIPAGRASILSANPQILLFQTFTLHIRCVWSCPCSCQRGEGSGSFGGHGVMNVGTR